MTENEVFEHIGDLAGDYKCFDEKISHQESLILCNLIEEIQQYRAIGTIEEFKTLKEKSVAKKISGKRFEEAICPRCESELFDTYWAFGGIHYCSNCGQAIDWQ